jgi:3-deoxy-alpha-D-manno-octulosonate 8-oxidase
MNYLKPFYQVPKLQYSDGDFSLISNLIPTGTNKILVVLDSKVKIDFALMENISHIEPVDVSESEPTVQLIDKLTKKLYDGQYDCIIGIGGGSVMDIAKSLSITLSDSLKRSAGEFQGWDLVFHNPIYKIGVPTLFGSGSEASRTAVLSTEHKKQGINSNYSMFDAVLLMPSLDQSADPSQKFYSGMDCYIHCVESSQGSFINDLSMSFAINALGICEDKFVNGTKDANMALASYFGGVSIVNSEVGVCHALSYGISQELGIRHGLANCLVFKELEEFYGKYVIRFNEMLELNNIKLDKNICSQLPSDQLDQMIAATYRMERPLMNALGANYKNVLTEECIREIYSRI